MPIIISGTDPSIWLLCSFLSGRSNPRFTVTFVRSHIKKPFGKTCSERKRRRVALLLIIITSLARYCSNYENFTRTLRHYE